MSPHDAAKARRTLQHAGTLADRNQLRSTLMSRLENDVHRLQAGKATVADDYRRKLERWRTEEVPENVTVCALPSEVHDSRFYRITGVFALLCEMALAAWIFSWLGVAWWIGVLVALGITTLHGIFLHVFDNPERPKEAIYRIRTRVSLPAVFGFLVAFALGMLARYVHGAVAVMLLPAFSFALWLGTLSLVILAASLFTIAHIQGWSARHERQYRELDDEERTSSAFLDELSADASSKAVAAAAQPLALIEAPAASNSNSAGKRAAGFLAGAIVAVVLISGTGCSTAASPSAPQPAATKAATLHIFVDTSGSCVRPALEESWKNVRRELPDIIERRDIAKLVVWQFDVDGWSPRRLTEIVLPARRLPVRQQTANNEWASFANIRDAVRADEEGDWHTQAAAAEQRYRESLASALKTLPTLPILPEADHETAGTDIAGLLRRISQTNEREPQHVIILTDLADTRYRALPKLPGPPGKVRVLVLLAPAQPKDAKMTLGKALPGPVQFDIRVRQLRESAPWIAVAPYFTDNLAELLASPSR